MEMTMPQAARTARRRSAAVAASATARRDRGLALGHALHTALVAAGVHARSPTLMSRQLKQPQLLQPPLRPEEVSAHEGA